ncbi:response regulator [Methanoregula sp. UBA64]|jgi:two-component system, response regulator PdtaR|uniref:response regulator n=1 Tax=Methanoregula sp. UBA64 TaxID=1915554 RepID=UPI0025D77056|nr:response regulator [Methanoregula sp. UBA64]
MPEKRIMIVEDETIVAMTLEDALRNMGYAVVGPVSTADDAVRLAETEKPDLILMDIRIKGDRDGISAAEEINEKHNIPIVYLTAHGDDKTLERAMKTQPYGYLTKPFRDRELHSTIEIALYKHRLVRQGKKDDAPRIPPAPVPQTAPASPAPPRVPPEPAAPPAALEKAILDIIDMPIFVIDSRMHLVYFNNALEQFFSRMGYLGVSSDRPVFDLAPQEFLGTPRMYREVFETRRISRMEKTLVTGDRQVTYSLVRVPLCSRDEVRFVAVILRDISKEQQYEQKLREIQVNYEKLLSHMGSITQLTGDARDPCMQEISKILSEMMVTMAKIDPERPGGPGIHAGT